MKIKDVKTFVPSKVLICRKGASGVVDREEAVWEDIKESRNWIDDPDGPFMREATAIQRLQDSGIGCQPNVFVVTFRPEGLKDYSETVLYIVEKFEPKD